jgi:hypothetical protein
MAAKKKQLIGLDFLEPSAFPNLAAVRAFVGGNDYSAMMTAVQDALHPDAEVPEDLVTVARDAAWWLLNDLEELRQAALAGDEIRAVRSGNWFTHGRAQLLAVVLGTSGTEEGVLYLPQFYQWLIDPLERGPMYVPEDDMRPEHHRLRARALASAECEGTA